MGSAAKTIIELYVINTAKELRIKNKLSQAELAHLLDVSYGFVGAVESTNHPEKYNLNHIEKLAQIFNRSPKDFLPE